MLTTKKIISSGAITAKEPGHFEVRTSSSQVTRMHFFPQNSWRPFFKSSPSKHKGHECRWDCFTVKIKQIKRSVVRYSKIFILFSVHTITEAKQRAEPGWWIFQPRHLTWRALM